MYPRFLGGFNERVAPQLSVASAGALVLAARILPMLDGIAAVCIILTLHVTNLSQVRKLVCAALPKLLRLMKRWRSTASPAKKVNSALTMISPVPERRLPPVSSANRVFLRT